MTAGQPPDQILDLVGIGFGPSNLALAIAVDEHNQRQPAPHRLTARFVEKQPRFGWHRGMLIDNATMQVSFLKDLVTVRNPASPFSFLTYLHRQGRLIDFINHKTLFPLRIEFHDYLEWAAAQLRDLVEYGSEVVDVRPVPAGNTVGHFEVLTRSTAGSQLPRTCRARSLAIAVGLQMCLPAGVRLGDRVWHNLDLLDRVGTLPEAPVPRRFVVVGAGQSAAETTEYLHRSFPQAEVFSVFTRYGYTPADDSPFANRIFDPAAVEEYFDAPREVKRMLFDYHRNTNYSVVDAELIEELYRRIYQESVQGLRRLHILNASRLAAVTETGNDVDVVVEHLPSGRRTALRADALVYATGYQPADPVRLLGATGVLCRRDADGELLVDRDYQVLTSTPTAGGIYLQGGTEHTHGITSTLLSNLATRAGEIVAAIASRSAAGEPLAEPAALLREPQPARSIAW